LGGIDLTLTVIDVAIGLIFVYLLMSLMCSIVQEFIANITSWRGKHLRNSIKAMLNDPTMTGLAERLYRHPRIATLTFASKLPSYIPSVTFAKALVDLVVEDNNFHPAVEGPLAPFIKDAKGEIDRLEAGLTKWFDDSMDGFSGWYKRNVQLVLFVLGLALAVVLNVNSLEIARVLWTQSLLRDAVGQSAAKFYQESDPAQVNPPQQDQIAKLQGQLDKLPLPIGWDQGSIACLFGRTSPSTATPAGPRNCRQPQGAVEGANLWWEWSILIAGWLVTALASSLGTQFWFNTLGEALALRAASIKPPKAVHENARPRPEG